MKLSFNFSNLSCNSLRIFKGVTYCWQNRKQASAILSPQIHSLPTTIPLIA